MSSHANRNPEDQHYPANHTNDPIKSEPVPTTITTTTTTTTLGTAPDLQTPVHQGRDVRPRRRLSGTPSESNSRSRSRSRSIHDSLSRSPSPQTAKPGRPNPMHRHHDRARKRSGGAGGSRSYHGRRNKRHTRELPYPSRSRSNSRSRSRSMSRSKSRSPSYSNDSDDGRRHRRHRSSRANNRDPYHRNRDRGGHRWRDNDHHNGTHMRGRHFHDRMGHNSDRNGDHHMNNGRNSGRNNYHENNNMNHHNRYNHNDDTHGGGGGANGGGGGGMHSDKTPVSFKEFTNRMLDDDVTPTEAQRRYEKYLQRFSKSDDVLFFEAHKDEEWFQERYDPIFIEKSIENRRQNARDQYWSFYEQFLCDELPEVHDNVRDFKDKSESTLLGHRSASPSRSPPPDPSTTTTTTTATNEVSSVKEEGASSTMKMDDAANESASITTTTTNGTGDDVNSGGMEVESTSATTITTTVIGGGGGNTGEQVEGQVDNDGDSHTMDVDVDESDRDKKGNEMINDGNNGTNGNGNGSGVPRDGKVRLPKYADIMFKDDYEPKERAGWDGGNWNRSECYENSVFIQGIPLHIQREKIMSLFSKRPGFEKLILSDPIRNARKVRYGWVTFADQESCREVLKSQEDGGLNGYNLTLQYTMNLLPKQRSKRKPKFSPPESLYSHRVRQDLQRSLECARKFDAEAGILDNPLLNDAMLKQLSPIRRLNLILLYLRKIHFLCYYCGKHFLSEEHLFARCSGMHERKVPADPSLAMSGNIDIDQRTENGQIIKKDQTNWEKDLDQRIHDVVHYVMDHKHSWVERKQMKMQEKHTKRVSESKFRCTICSKLFKAEQYVTKHIGNKHQMDIAKYIADQRLRTMFENYRRDRDRLTLKSFEVTDDGNALRNRRNDKHGKHGIGGGRDRHHGLFGANGMRPQHPLNRMGNYGPQPMNGNQFGSPYGHGMAGYHPPNGMAPGGPPGNAVNGPPPGGMGRGMRGSMNGNGNGGGNGTGMHPERESNLSSHSAMAPNGGSPTLRRDGFEGGMGRGQYNEPRGRQIRMHVPGPTRTRRSYREVDIEFPEEEAEEEIDYGFGDFDKNPTKFNL